VKFNITILFLFLLNAPKGQSIRFQLIRKDFCTRLSHIDSTGYSLIDNQHDSTYIALYQSKKGIISLPKPGTYYLDTYYLDSLFVSLRPTHIVRLEKTELLCCNEKQSKRFIQKGNYVQIN
jgi:hypothetical protein